MKTCTNCGREEKRDQNRAWWYLRGYFDLNGFFCPDCYDLVRHDSYDRPVNPGSYKAILEKLKQ